MFTLWEWLHLWQVWVLLEWKWQVSIYTQCSLRLKRFSLDKWCYSDRTKFGFFIMPLEFPTHSICMTHASVLCWPIFDSTEPSNSGLISVVICSCQSIRLHMIWFGCSAHAQVVVHARTIHLLLFHSLSCGLPLGLDWCKNFQTSLILSQKVDWTRNIAAPQSIRKTVTHLVLISLNNHSTQYFGF